MERAWNDEHTSPWTISTIITIVIAFTNSVVDHWTYLFRIIMHQPRYSLSWLAHPCLNIRRFVDHLKCYGPTTRLCVILPRTIYGYSGAYQHWIIQLFSVNWFHRVDDMRYCLTVGPIWVWKDDYRKMPSGRILTATWMSRLRTNRLLWKYQLNNKQTNCVHYVIDIMILENII